MEEHHTYGGQAVIGGVLINSPKGWSLAVRDNHGEINRYFEKGACCSDG